MASLRTLPAIANVAFRGERFLAGRAPQGSHRAERLSGSRLGAVVSRGKFPVMTRRRTLKHMLQTLHPNRG
jgi:hypothetical protein